MGSERNYQVKILSNQIKQYSTVIPATVPLLYPKVYNPWFVTGFTDAEGSFIVSISKYPGALNFFPFFLINNYITTW